MDGGTHSPFIQLVLGRLALPIASDDLHLVDLHEVGHLPELHIVQDESPHVVAESVGVQGALEDRKEPRVPSDDTRAAEDEQKLTLSSCIIAPKLWLTIRLPESCLPAETSAGSAGDTVPQITRRKWIKMLPVGWLA